jgi:MerR family gold-responsive transcriptional activator of gol and ges genes
LALGHVEALRRKIAELEGMVGTLEALAECCSGDGRPDCPILTDLAAGDAVTAATPAAPRFGASGGRDPIPPERQSGR